MTPSWEGEQSNDKLIRFVFSDIKSRGSDPSYIVSRAILAPNINDVEILNEKIIRMFPGDEHHFFSFDKVTDDNDNLYPEDYLNSISPNGMPPHTLILKKKEHQLCF